MQALAKYYGLEEKYPLIRDWYNGYVFGQTNVYNPWSVIKFIFDLTGNKNVFPSSYWANTSSNSIVKSLIEKADSKTKQEIELLIEGKTIEKIVHEDITYDEIFENGTPIPNVIGVSDSHKKQVFGSLLMDNLWNFMFFTGYFKKVSERMDEQDNRYLELSIPNREVKYIFRTKILKWFEEKIKAKDLSILYTAIFNKDSETFQKELNKLLREAISFNDAYENFYHGFVVGVLSNMHDYIVKSNRESGDGRSDIYIKSPSIFDPAVIMELKVCKEPKEIYKMCDEALDQIEKNKYDEDLKQEGYENIIKYGIYFYGKDCIVKLDNRL